MTLKIKSNYKKSLFVNTLISILILALGLLIEKDYKMITIIAILSTITFLILWLMLIRESYCFEIHNLELKITNPLKVFKSDYNIQLYQINNIKIFNYISAYNEKRIEIIEKNGNRKIFRFHSVSQQEIEEFINRLVQHKIMIDYQYGNYKDKTIIKYNQGN